MTQYIAVIEWPSGAIESPNVYVAPTIDGLITPVMEGLGSLVDEAFVGDEGWKVAEHPMPDANDVEASKAWLIEMRDNVTAVWVNLYHLEDGQVGTTDLPLRQTLTKESA